MLTSEKRTGRVLPKVGPKVLGRVDYPRANPARPVEGKFRWENSAEQTVAAALDRCPIGTLVAFRFMQGEKVVAKNAFTKGSPFYLNGEVYVEICGQTRAFRLSSLRILDRFAVEQGDEDGMGNLIQGL